MTEQVQTITDYEIDFTDEDGGTYTYNIDYRITKEESGAYTVTLLTIRDENGEEIEDDAFMNDALTRSILEEHDYGSFDGLDEDIEEELDAEFAEELDEDEAEEAEEEPKPGEQEQSQG